MQLFVPALPEYEILNFYTVRHLNQPYLLTTDFLQFSVTNLRTEYFHSKLGVIRSLQSLHPVYFTLKTWTGLQGNTGCSGASVLKLFKN